MRKFIGCNFVKSILKNKVMESILFQIITPICLYTFFSYKYLYHIIYFLNQIITILNGKVTSFLLKNCIIISNNAIDFCFIVNISYFP